MWTAYRSQRRLLGVGLMAGVLVWAAGCTTAPTPLVPRRSGDPFSSQNIRNIRVLLANTSKAAVAVAGQYTIKESGQDGRVLATGHDLRGSLISVVKRQGLRVRIGELDCPPGPVDLIPEQRGSLQIKILDGERVGLARRYDGLLRVVPIGNGTLRLVNHIDIETYVAGVLVSELYESFQPATYEAQAITARTFVLYEKATRGSRKSYDVLATEGSQVYTGIGSGRAWQKALNAVTRSEGIVCSWTAPAGERIFCTYYSACCGGGTQSVANFKNQPAIPPLRGGVACRYCRIAKGNIYRWPEVRLSMSEITRRVVERYPHLADLGRLERVEVASTISDGRTLYIRLCGDSGRTFDMRSEDFRLSVGGHTLRSTHFELRMEGDEAVFYSGRGFGHGAGMCQWGAEGQARLGRDASQILAYYYPTSHLTKAYN